MKKILLLLLAVMMTFSFVTVMAAKNEDVTIVYNGGFEKDLFNWKYEDRSADANATFEVVSENPKSGEKALEITSGHHSIAFQPIGLLEGEEYTMKVYARASAADKEGQFSVRLEFNTIVGAYVDAAESDRFTVKGDKWQEFTFKFKVPATATDANMYILHLSGTLCYDDVQVDGVISDRVHEFLEDIKIKELALTAQEALGANMVPNPGFEELDENGHPVSRGIFGGWDGPIGSVETEDVRTGNYAAKLESTDGSFVHTTVQIKDLTPGATYQASFWYKGIANGPRTSYGLIVETYQENVISSQTATGQYGPPRAVPTNNWTHVFTTFKLPDTANMVQIVAFMIDDPGIMLVDDFEFVLVKAPEISKMETDQVFYYPDAEYGTAVVTFDNYYEKDAYTVDFKLTDANDKELLSVKNVPEIDYKAQLKFQVGLMKEKKKQYMLTAVVKDKDGNVIAEHSQDLYVYPRPTVFNENGQYVEENGEIFDPVFIFQVPKDKWDECQAAGMNTLLWVIPSSLGEAIEQLDELHSMGMKAGVVCFWDMYPAGHPINQARVSAAIRQIKDHPAIYCWIVMDEPYGHDPYASENLKNSYKMIRDIDDKYPVTNVESVRRMYDESGKYADMMITDIYPGSSHDYQKYIASGVELAYGYLSEEGKPISQLHQAFFFDGKGPTPEELRHMNYQTFLAGGQGLGYYAFSPNNPAYDKMLDESIYWDILMEFREKEQDIMFAHFSSDNKPAFNRYHGEKYWYETWTDGKDMYAALMNTGSTEVDATVSLESSNGLITVEDYDIEIINGGELSDVTKNKGSFDVKLEGVGAVLYKIIPKTTVDFSSLTEIGDKADYDWAKEAIELMYEKGIVDADDSYRYRPSDKITRAEFASMLIRTIGIKVKGTAARFADVDPLGEYSLEIATGKELEILKGVGDEKYNPDAEISRQDLMVICARGMRLLKQLEAFDAAGLDSFSDKDMLADYATADVLAMVNY